MVDCRYDQTVNLETRVIQKGHKGFDQQKIGRSVISEMLQWKKELDKTSVKGPRQPRRALASGQDAARHRHTTLKTVMSKWPGPQGFRPPLSGQCRGGRRALSLDGTRGTLRH